MAHRVLIVEDHHLVRAGFKSLLYEVDSRCDVVEAGSYQEAVKLLSEQQFDLLFIDIDLRSERSGIDLLRVAREMDGAAKIIMLSATDDVETILGCISAGASGYIAKTTDDQSSVTQAIATVLSDGVYLPAAVLQRSMPIDRFRQTVSDQATLEKLAPRMREVLYYLCQGLSNKEIARKMGISEGTVRKNYVSALLQAFKVTRRTALVIEVSRRGLQLPRPQTQWQEESIY